MTPHSRTLQRVHDLSLALTVALVVLGVSGQPLGLAHAAHADPHAPALELGGDFDPLSVATAA